jgi:hypothetical protein
VQVRIDNFGGLVLTKDQKKGPFWTALKATNCDIQSGSIDLAYSLDTAVAVNLTGASPRRTIYNIDGSTFLEWEGDIDIARSPLADNTSRRVYFTGEYEPRVTDLAMAIAGNAPYPAKAYVLGITIGTAVFNMQTVGGSGSETRAYVYTFVSPWGEEGPPSAPASIATASAGPPVLTLRGLGVTTRRYSSAPAAPQGITAAITFIGAPAPGFLRINFTDVGYQADFRAGDRLYFYGLPTIPGEEGFHEGFAISNVDSTGNGSVDIAANCWNGLGVSPAVFRQMPVNTYNVINFVANSPSAGKSTVFVDTIAGLRVGETVGIVGMGGPITGYVNSGGAMVVDSLGPDPQNPSFVVNHIPTVAVPYTSGGVATRKAPHNVGETRIQSVAFAAGVATLRVDSTAHLEAGDPVLILGLMGCYELNGKRTILGVNHTAGEVTIAIAAMGAWITSTGTLIHGSPHEIKEATVTNVTSAGGPYPTRFLITYTVTKHDFAIGDLVLGQDIGGAIEANNVGLVQAVTATTVVTTSATGVTAYTAGGKLVGVAMQTRKRLYRTATGTAAAEYQFVDEIAGDKHRFEDSKANGALGDVLETDAWIQPPVDMHSVVVHPHGFLMGISKNILCKSEPYQPHAWPLAYQHAMPADGVGLGQYGISAVAMTEEIPFVVTGVSPDTMTRSRQDVGEPCTSKRSVVSTGLGAAYRGASGMFLIGYQGSSNATENYLPPGTFSAAADTISAFWGNKLIWIDNATQTGYIFDPVREDKGLTQFTVDFPIYDLHVSPVDGQLWASYVEGGLGGPKRAPLFKIVATPAKFTYWTQYIPFTKPISIGALQVDWEWPLQSATMKARESVIVRNRRNRSGADGSIAVTQISDYALGSDGLEALYSPDTTLTIPTERFLKVTLIANPGNTDIERTVFDDFVVNDLPVTVEDGIAADSYQVRLEGNAKVTAVTIAESIDELEQT